MSKIRIKVVFTQQGRPNYLVTSDEMNQYMEVDSDELVFLTQNLNNLGFTFSDIRFIPTLIIIDNSVVEKGLSTIKGFLAERKRMTAIKEQKNELKKEKADNAAKERRKKQYEKLKIEFESNN